MALTSILEVAMLKKFGPTDLAEHYAEFDTICDATQVRSRMLVAYYSVHYQPLSMRHML